MLIVWVLNWQVEAIAVSADCVRCVVASSDGNVYVYNLRSAELLFTFFNAERAGPVADLRLSSDDRFIFSATRVSHRRSVFRRIWRQTSEF